MFQLSHFFISAKGKKTPSKKMSCFSEKMTNPIKNERVLTYSLNFPKWCNGECSVLNFLISIIEKMKTIISNEGKKVIFIVHSLNNQIIFNTIYNNYFW